MKAPVEPVRPCVCSMWFLAKARAEIGLPVRAVYRESDDAKSKLNSSTVLQLE